MAWIIPAESDLLTTFSETELATYRAAATASGQADPVAPTLAQVVDLVAVRLPQRVGVSPKDVRQAAATQAVKLLEQVAAGVFNIEEPDSPTLETTEAPYPTIEARRRHFTPRSEEGV